MAQKAEDEQPSAVGAIYRGGQRALEDPKLDPWKHRSAGMRCRTCMFYVQKQAHPASGGLKKGEIGRCRAHSPTMRGFPVVFPTDWCGDHRVDEDRL